MLQISPRLSGLERSSHLTVSLGRMAWRDPLPRRLSSRQPSGGRAVVPSRLSPGSSHFQGAGGEIQFLPGHGRRPPPALCQGASHGGASPFTASTRRRESAKDVRPGHVDETPAPTPCPPAWQPSLRAACPRGPGLCTCVDPGAGTQVPVAV